MAGAVTRPLPSWARLKLASNRACLTEPGRRFTPGSRRLFGCASAATGASARPLATAGHFIRKPSAATASILEISVSEFGTSRVSQSVYILNVVNLKWRNQVAVRVLPAATCFHDSTPPHLWGGGAEGAGGAQPFKTPPHLWGGGAEGAGGAQPFKTPPHLWGGGAEGAGGAEPFKTPPHSWGGGAEGAGGAERAARYAAGYVPNSLISALASSRSLSAASAAAGDDASPLIEKST